MIAFRAEDKNSHEDDSTTVQPPGLPVDELYEVRKTKPRHGDSFIGGLDILTVHQMIEEQNQAARDAQKKDSSDDVA